MNWLSSLERASSFGLAALAVALLAQWFLSSRVPAAWRVWIWRVALLQTALVLIPLAPLRLALLPPSPHESAETLPTSVEQAPVSAPAPILLKEPILTAPSKEAFSPSSRVGVAPQTPPSSSILPPAPSSNTQTPETIEPRPSWNWQTLLFAAYLLGVLAHIAFAVRSAVRVRRILRASESVQDSNLNARLGELARRFGIRRAPRLVQFDDTPPFLVGVFRPAIVVSRSLRELGSAHLHLEAVLTHELAHLKRRDLMWSALLWAAQTLFWFHPLVWATRRFHTLEVESACDELVLKTTRIPAKSYGELLVNTLDFHPSLLTAGVGDGFFALKTRLQRLNQSPRTPRKIALVAFVAVTALTFCALIPFRLVARAQDEPETASTVTKPTPAPVEKKAISGTVTDVKGRPVEGATVYWLERETREGKILDKTRSDAAGKFRFNISLSDRSFTGYVFADAGAKGMNSEFVSLFRGYEPRPVHLPVASKVRARVRLLDAQNRPVPNMVVHLGGIWRSTETSIWLPQHIWDTLEATTDAQGVAVLPPLPQGMYIRFQLGNKKLRAAQPGVYGRFAPIAADDYLHLSGPAPTHTIRLIAPVRLVGRVRLGEGGPGASNVPFSTHRITPDEERGKNDIGTESRWIQGKTDAQGNYSVEGLRPGKYRIWFGTGELAKDWVVEPVTRTLAAPVNRVDIAFSKGAIVEGTVVSQETGRPVQGQRMRLRDANENNQVAFSDVQGKFRFRTIEGVQRLRVEWDGDKSPPSGFILPPNTLYRFSIVNGARRSFKIELPGASVTKPLTGTVVGPDGNSIAGAKVLYRRAGDFYPWEKEIPSVKCDASGRFTIPRSEAGKPLQLFADAGEMTTARSTVAFNEEVKLQVQPNAWSAIQGRVVDENQQPIVGATVSLMITYSGTSMQDRDVQSDKSGMFRFDHLRPGTGATVQVTKAKYSSHYESVKILAAGSTTTLKVVTHSAPKTLSGTVFQEDGTPAGGFQVSAPGLGTAQRTRADGKFFLSQVVAGPLSVRIYSSKGQMGWQPFPAQGGDKNLVLRLTKAGRYPGSGTMRTSFGSQQQALVGQDAPEIKAAKWSDNRATSLASLRGKVVLLVMDAFNFRGTPELRDFAKSQAGKVAVVGVQIQLKLPKNIKTDVDEISQQMGFPVALDAPPLSSATGIGQTAASYAQSQYVVIGRNGKILYAGSYLNRAFTLAMTTTR